MIRRSVLQIMVVGIAVMILSLLYFFYPASPTSFHPKCPFHQLTGFHCPGCGSQRAASALLNGDFNKAISLNILFVLSIPFILFSMLAFFWNTFSAKKIQQTLFYQPWFAKGLVTLVLLFWILRNIPVHPFNWLAP